MKTLISAIEREYVIWSVLLSSRSVEDAYASIQLKDECPSCKQRAYVLASRWSIKRAIRSAIRQGRDHALSCGFDRKIALKAIMEINANINAVLQNKTSLSIANQFNAYIRGLIARPIQLRGELSDESSTYHDVASTVCALTHRSPPNGRVVK